MDKFCSDCWEYVVAEFDEVEGGWICPECEWINLFDSEGEAEEALKWDADAQRGEDIWEDMFA